MQQIQMMARLQITRTVTSRILMNPPDRGRQNRKSVTASPLKQVQVRENQAGRQKARPRQEATIKRNPLLARPIPGTRAVQIR